MPTTGLDVADLDLVGCIPVPPGFAELVAGIEATLVVDGGVHDAIGPMGLSPRATARLGRAVLALELGDRPGATAWDRLGWLLERATPTGTWPAIVHPRTGRGSAGPGHDPIATAELLLLTRDLLVREGASGLVLCSAWPDAWLGQSLEVHDAPTALGRCSFAVRWHGERPAVLWEVEEPEIDPQAASQTPPASGAPFALRVPGLDPTWSTPARKGEALLAAPVTDQATSAGGSFV